MNKLIFILNGPNLNLLGQRQVDIYGTETLDDITRACVKLGADLGLEVEQHQSNHEGTLVDMIHQARDAADRDYHQRSPPIPIHPWPFWMR